MNYTCLKHQEQREGIYRILPIRLEDIYKIKNWRNEQIDILRQSEPLTDDMQLNYYQNVIKPSFSLTHPKQILFSLLKDDSLVGYGGIVHIDWKEKIGEISFLIETDRAKNDAAYKAAFFPFLTMLKRVAFEDLGFQRIFAETYDIRPLHIAILEEAGFKFEKRLKNRVNINGQFIDALIHGYQDHV